LIVHTFWKRDDLQCVLVRQGDRFSVQVLIRDTAAITEPCSPGDDAADVADRAAKLFGVFDYSEAQPLPR
jgi:hypothetical protein